MNPPAPLSRRAFLQALAAGTALTLPLMRLPLLAQNLKEGAAPIPEPHFPNRLFLFVWRNWELANTDRLAMVVHTTNASVLRLGAMLGLPEKPRLSVPFEAMSSALNQNNAGICYLAFRVWLRAGNWGAGIKPENRALFSMR